MANGNNKRLKAFVRYDGTGRVVPSSLILARFKPKVGNYKEIDAYECCNPGSTTTTTSSSTTSTTTTNPGYYTWTVYFGEGELDACNQEVSSTVYTSGPDFTGSVLYTDTALTTPVIGGGNVAIVTPGGKFVYTITAGGEATSPVPC